MKENSTAFLPSTRSCLGGSVFQSIRIFFIAHLPVFCARVVCNSGDWRSAVDYTLAVELAIVIFRARVISWGDRREIWMTIRTLTCLCFENIALELMRVVNISLMHQEAIVGNKQTGATERSYTGGETASFMLYILRSNDDELKECSRTPSLSSVIKYLRAIIKWKAWVLLPVVKQ